MLTASSMVWSKSISSISVIKSTQSRQANPSSDSFWGKKSCRFVILSSGNASKTHSGKTWAATKVADPKRTQIAR